MKVDSYNVISTDDHYFAGVAMALGFRLKAHSPHADNVYSVERPWRDSGNGSHAGETKIYIESKSREGMILKGVLQAFRQPNKELKNWSTMAPRIRNANTSAQRMRLAHALRNAIPSTVAAWCRLYRRKLGGQTVRLEDTVVSPDEIRASEILDKIADELWRPETSHLPAPDTDKLAMRLDFCATPALVGYLKAALYHWLQLQHAWKQSVPFVKIHRGVTLPPIIMPVEDAKNPQKAALWGV